MLVKKVERLSGMHGRLLPGDVILSVGDGHRITNDGRISRPGSSPMDFRSALTRLLVGEATTLRIFRAGGTRLDLPVLAEDPPLLVPDINHVGTSYCVFAGLVFAPVTHHLAHRSAADDSDAAVDSVDVFASYTSLDLYLKAGKVHERADQQIVTLAALLPHSLMLGYDFHAFRARPLLKIDGAAVVNLADVHRRTQEAKGRFITFEFATDVRITLPLAASRRATKELMEEHRIAHEAHITT